jgi:hypothetical protein
MCPAVGHGHHRRTPTLAADLIAGFNLFLEFAVQVNAITDAQSNELQQRCIGALLTVAAEQSSHHGSSDPCTRYLQLLAAALSSGRAHVAGMQGEHPAESPQVWGWRSQESTDGSYGDWQPQGRCIGWLDGDDLYLEPDAAYAEAQRLAGDQGDPIAVGQGTLLKRLHERHLLAGTDTRPGHLKVRRTIAGVRRAVLYLRAEQVIGADAGGPTGPGGPED